MEREKALGDFGVMKIFCTMIGIILTKMFTLTTTHQSLHSNWVNFFEYELYLKKILTGFTLHRKNIMQYYAHQLQLHHFKSELLNNIHLW